MTDKTEGVFIIENTLVPFEDGNRFLGPYNEDIVRGKRNQYERLIGLITAGMSPLDARNFRLVHQFVAYYYLKTPEFEE